MLDINKFSNKLLTQGYLGCFIPHEKSLVIIFYIPEENKPKKNVSNSSVIIPILLWSFLMKTTKSISG